MQTETKCRRAQWKTLMYKHAHKTTLNLLAVGGRTAPYGQPQQAQPACQFASGQNLRSVWQRAKPRTLASEACVPANLNSQSSLAYRIQCRLRLRPTTIACHAVACWSTVVSFYCKRAPLQRPDHALTLGRRQAICAARSFSVSPCRSRMQNPPHDGFHSPTIEYHIGIAIGMKCCASHIFGTASISKCCLSTMCFGHSLALKHNAGNVTSTFLLPAASVPASCICLSLTTHSPIYICRATPLFYGDSIQPSPHPNFSAQLGACACRLSIDARRRQCKLACAAWQPQAPRCAHRC